MTRFFDENEHQLSHAAEVEPGKYDEYHAPAPVTVRTPTAQETVDVTAYPAEWTLMPPDLYSGYELALWHYRYIYYWRKDHNTDCPCGQPDDGEHAFWISPYLEAK